MNEKGGELQLDEYQISHFQTHLRCVPGIQMSWRKIRLTADKPFINYGFPVVLQFDADG